VKKQVESSQKGQEFVGQLDFSRRHVYQPSSVQMRTAPLTISADYDLQSIPTLDQQLWTEIKRI
jgi:hypothetical protein